MQRKPILSFCIPTWNRAQRVYDCVRHILSYLGDEIEVVVSDNASDDNTLSLLGSIDDKRLRYTGNEENIGALNWPLVVSYAAGEWAALMSDEDNVCLENLPYFLKLLCGPDFKDIGVITYSFPPIFYYEHEYKCKSQLESVSMGGRHSGHITGHIVNREYFRLDDLSEWDYLQNLYDCKANPSIPLEKYIAEVPYELVGRIAQNHTVFYTKYALCSFGKDLDQKRVSAKAFDWKTFNDMSYSNIDHIVAALYKRIVQFSKTTSITDDNSTRFSAAIMSIYEEMAVILFDYLNSIYRGDHSYRPALFALAKSELGYTREDVKAKALESIQAFTRKYPPFVNENLFLCLHDYLKDLIYDNPFRTLADNLKFELRVMLGNTLQISYLSYLSFSTSKMNSKGFYKGGFFDDFDDLLELRETDKMMRHLRKKQYDRVIEDFEYVKSHRKHYLLGISYFHKSQWGKAKYEFELFLNVVKNPKTIADIVTGAYSIQSAYYYLGYIHQKLNDHCTALDYYAKCKKLSDDLMLGWNLYDKRLGLKR